jgi:signal transduction histidine kinase
MPAVLGDEDLIEQIITNYMTNAIRFTPEGGEITVSAELQSNEVHIHVRDTGVGIPEKYLTNIWKRFYKVNESRYQCKEGAGLGLALVKQMVEKLNGRAWATSILGQGSVFSFSLLTNRPND